MTENEISKLAEEYAIKHCDLSNAEDRQGAKYDFIKGFKKAMEHCAKISVNSSKGWQNSFNKNLPEVAVAFAEWIDGCGYSRMIDKVDGKFEFVGWTEGNETIARTTEELFEIFQKCKSAKATDR